MPDRLKESSIIELAVIGGGPAGISAVIQAKKLGLRVILIEANKLGGRFGRPEGLIICRRFRR